MKSNQLNHGVIVISQRNETPRQFTQVCPGWLTSRRRSLKQ